MWRILTYRHIFLLGVAPQHKPRRPRLGPDVRSPGRMPPPSPRDTSATSHKWCDPGTTFTTVLSRGTREFSLTHTCGPWFVDPKVVHEPPVEKWRLTARALSARALSARSRDFSRVNARLDTIAVLLTLISVRTTAPYCPLLLVSLHTEERARQKRRLWVFLFGLTLLVFFFCLFVFSVCAVWGVSI